MVQFGLQNSTLRSGTSKMKLRDQHITSKDFEPRLGNGAVVYGRWFGKTLDAEWGVQSKPRKPAENGTRIG